MIPGLWHSLSPLDDGTTVLPGLPPTESRMTRTTGLEICKAHPQGHERRREVPGFDAWVITYVCPSRSLALSDERPN